MEETIKPSSKISTERLLYVAYPVAEFSVNGLRICKSDQRLKSVPEVGDSILVFPLNDPLNEEKNLIYPYFQEVMVQKRDGTLAIPDKWMKDAALEKASDLREIEGIVRTIEKPAVEKPVCPIAASCGLWRRPESVPYTSEFLETRAFDGNVNWHRFVSTYSARCQPTVASCR